MPVTDPRDRHDDLVEWRVEKTVDADGFADHRAMEAFQSGWVATGLVFDGEGRLLLAYEDDDKQWFAPGGTLVPGESLTEGLAREIREETGVEASPDRPHGVADLVVRHDGASTSFTVVFFEAVAETTAIGDDLGDDDESIVDADWFTDLPGSVYNRDWTEDVLDRCDRWEW